MNRSDSTRHVSVVGFHALVVMTLAIAQTAAASTAEVSAPPVREGDTWVYQSTESRDAQPARILRLRLTAVHHGDSGTLFLAMQPASAPANSQSLLSGTIDDQDCMVDIAARQVLSLAPCDAPGKFRDSWTVPVNSDKFREVRLLGREHLTVPAGDFETLKFETSEHIRDDLPIAARSKVWLTHSTVWYAPSLAATVRAERTVENFYGVTLRRTVDVLESFGHGDARQVFTNRIAPPADLGSRAPTMSPACRPKYPTAAERANATGVSRVRLAIDAEGHPTDAELVGASGATREHRLLDDTAREALASCSFVPATGEDGKPVASIIDVSYRWELR